MIQAKVQTEESNSVMIMIMESNGKDITETPFQMIAKNKNPGFYFGGFSCIEVSLPPGEYNVIVAAQNTV